MMTTPDDGRRSWDAAYRTAAENGKVRDADFSTISGLEVEPVYGPPEGSDDPRLPRIGWPGEFPFTRGLYPTGYRGRSWTIRQFAGFGNAQQTNERYKMILASGGGGLSVACDMPTLLAYASHAPVCLAEGGRRGGAFGAAA